MAQVTIFCYEATYDGTTYTPTTGGPFRLTFTYGGQTITRLVV